MKLLLLFIAGGLVSFIILMIFTNRYVDPPNGTNYVYPDPFCEHDKLHGDPDNEFSPDQIDLDKTLKVIKLRSKLKKIESEKNDVGIDYQNENGL
jgi:hypothetical protein